MVDGRPSPSAISLQAPSPYIFWVHELRPFTFLEFAMQPGLVC